MSQAGFDGGLGLAQSRTIQRTPNDHRHNDRNARDHDRCRADWQQEPVMPDDSKSDRREHRQHCQRQRRQINHHQHHKRHKQQDPSHARHVSADAHCLAAAREPSFRCRQLGSRVMPPRPERVRLRDPDRAHYPKNACEESQHEEHPLALHSAHYTERKHHNKQHYVHHERSNWRCCRDDYHHVHVIAICKCRVYRTRVDRPRPLTPRQPCHQVRRTHPRWRPNLRHSTVLTSPMTQLVGTGPQ